MELHISLSAAPLSSLTVRVGDALQRALPSGKFTVGAVMAVDQNIEVRYKEIGVEKYSRQTFDRMIAKKIIKPAKKELVEGIKGAIRKDNFRSRVKAETVIDTSRGRDAHANNVTSKVERDMDLAYNGEERNRAATIEAVLAEAKKNGYFDTFIQRHALYKDLMAVWPKAKIEPLLRDTIPNRADYQAGISPLTPIGLKVRLPGFSYFIKIQGRRSIAKRWSVEVGSLGTFDAANAEEIAQWVEDRTERADKRSSKAATTALKSAAKMRVAEVNGLHEASLVTLRRIEERLTDLIAARSTIEKFHKNMPGRGKQYPALIEKAITAYGRASTETEKLKAETANNRKVVSSSLVVKLRNKNRLVEELVEAAEHLYSELDFGFRRLDLSLSRTKKAPTKRTK